VERRVSVRGHSNCYQDKLAPRSCNETVVMRHGERESSNSHYILRGQIQDAAHAQLRHLATARTKAMYGTEQAKCLHFVVCADMAMHLSRTICWQSGTWTLQYKKTPQVLNETYSRTKGTSSLLRCHVLHLCKERRCRRYTQLPLCFKGSVSHTQHVIWSEELFRTWNTTEIHA
jgi:hypothetical protein